MQRLVSLLLGLLLVVTGVAYALHVDGADGADEGDSAEGADAHGGDHPGVESDREARLARASSGRVPTELDALGLERHGSIALRADTPWTPSHGVSAGSGTPEDPYLIDGVYADIVYIADTAVDFEIRNSYIGHLVLDWHGNNGLVHHNRILALNTNRNVERTGGPSAAVIVHNVIDEVTQLRHFDGLVADNVIGRETTNILDRRVAFDIAGFNGAEIRDNLVHGGVDIKVHGHHHDDGSGRLSHNHGAADGAQEESYGEDHAERHHALDFHDNVIVDPFGFGLRYNDLNHAGDDRQATSEQEPMLETPHVHFTYVKIRDNALDGAPIRVEVFMAPDELHRGGRGTMEITGNRVLNATTKDGILIGAVKDADVLVAGNSLSKLTPLLRSYGIRALHLENSTLRVLDNRIDGFHYGVVAQDFDANTTWSVEGNRVSGAAKDVFWDESVANPPEGGSHEGHEHGDAVAGARRTRLV